MNRILGSLARDVKIVSKWSLPYSILKVRTILFIVLNLLYIFWFWLRHWAGLRVLIKWDICLNILLVLCKRVYTCAEVWSVENLCCSKEMPHTLVFLQDSTVPHPNWCFELVVCVFWVIVPHCFVNWKVSCISSLIQVCSDTFLIL